MNFTYLFISAAVGAIIGSFLNVVIHRGPALWGLVEDDTRIGNLAWPGSYCPSCKTPIPSLYMIPVLGYFLTARACRTCKAPIPVRYPVVEILGAASAGLAFIIFGPSFAGVSAAVFLWLAIALAVIDWETGYLPDALTITSLCAGLAVNTIDTITPLPDALIGALAGYLIFRLIGAAFHQLRGVEGLGQGDAKFLSAIGAWLGWQALSPVVLIAALTGLAGFGVVKLLGRDINTETPIPFGPAMAASASLVLLAASLV